MAKKGIRCASSRYDFDLNWHEAITDILGLEGERLIAQTHAEIEERRAIGSPPCGIERLAYSPSEEAIRKRKKRLEDKEAAIRSERKTPVIRWHDWR
jgi:hypothetical protein